MGAGLESLLCQCMLKDQIFYRAGVIAPAPIAIGYIDYS